MSNFLNKLNELEWVSLDVEIKLVKEVLEIYLKECLYLDNPKYKLYVKCTASFGEIVVDFENKELRERFSRKTGNCIIGRAFDYQLNEMDNRCLVLSEQKNPTKYLTIKIHISHLKRNSNLHKLAKA